MATNARVPPFLFRTDHRQRSLAQLRSKASGLEQYIFLNGLKERDPNLFYELLLGNMLEIIPILYTPTVILFLSVFVFCSPDSKRRWATLARITRIFGGGLKAYTSRLKTRGAFAMCSGRGPESETQELLWSQMVRLSWPVPCPRYSLPPKARVFLVSGILELMVYPSALANCESVRGELRKLTRPTEICTLQEQESSYRQLCQSAWTSAPTRRSFFTILSTLGFVAKGQTPGR